jgi:predicted MFS family arabinose efflux permease
MLSEYVDGLRFLIKKVDLLWISLHKAAWGLIAGGMFSVLIVQLSKDVFPIGEAGGITLGLLYAVAGIGTGIGPILARRFTGDREIPVRVAIGLSYFITSAGLIIASLLSSLGVVLLGNFIRAFGGGIIWVFSTMLLFVLVPERFRGRVLSTEFAFFALASALGSALGGWAIDQSSITFQTILLWTGLVSMIPGFLWFLWIRNRGGKSNGDDVQQMEEVQGFPEPVPSPPHRPYSKADD